MIKSLKGGSGIESLVCPCVGWTAVLQVNETTLLYIITKHINTINIRPTQDQTFH